MALPYMASSNRNHEEWWRCITYFFLEWQKGHAFAKPLSIHVHWKSLVSKSMNMNGRWLSTSMTPKKENARWAQISLYLHHVVHTGEEVYQLLEKIDLIFHACISSLGSVINEICEAQTYQYNTFKSLDPCQKNGLNVKISSTMPKTWAQVQEAWLLVYHLYKVSFCEEMSEETRMKSLYLQLLWRQVQEDLSPHFLGLEVASLEY
jgi:hypothetical protein